MTSYCGSRRKWCSRSALSLPPLHEMSIGVRTKRLVQDRDRNAHTGERIHACELRTDLRQGNRFSQQFLRMQPSLGNYLQHPGVFPRLQPVRPSDFELPRDHLTHWYGRLALIPEEQPDLDVPPPLPEREDRIAAGDGAAEGID